MVKAAKKYAIYFGEELWHYTGEWKKGVPHGKGKTQPCLLVTEPSYVLEQLFLRFTSRQGSVAA